MARVWWSKAKTVGKFGEELDVIGEISGEEEWLGKCVERGVREDEGVIQVREDR